MKRRCDPVIAGLKRDSNLISVTGKDELNKLVCSYHVNPHSSVGRALQRPWVRIPLKH